MIYVEWFIGEVTQHVLFWNKAKVLNHERYQILKRPQLYINTSSEFRHQVYQPAFAPLQCITFLPWQLRVNALDQHKHLTKFIAYTTRTALARVKSTLVYPNPYPPEVNPMNLLIIIKECREIIRITMFA